jgi:hypothetical protein
MPMSSTAARASSTLGVLFALVGFATVAAARSAPVVDWREAGSHVGEFVTVEGDVVDAHMIAEGCVLEFGAAASDFRAVLIVPVLSDLPRQPERLYRGKRVRATGRVQRFQGRPEMVLQNPGQIEVVGIQATEPAVEPASTPPPSALPSASPTPPTPPPSTPSPLPAAPAPTPPVPTPPAPTAEPAPPRGLIEDVQRRLTPPDPCAQARARWREAAATARPHAAALEHCLETTGYRCHPEAAALGPALSALEWAEQQVADACR